VIKEENSENSCSIKMGKDRKCCDIGIAHQQCICSYSIYKIRPYMIEIMRAINPFFETMAISNMTHHILEQIVDHIEAVLNKPIADTINR
jgi:hypothetical protein